MAEIVKKAGKVLRAREGFVLRKHNPAAMNRVDFGATALTIVSSGTAGSNDAGLILELEAIPAGCAKVRVIVFGSINGAPAARAVVYENPTVGVNSLGSVSDTIADILGQQALTFVVEGARAGEDFGQPLAMRTVGEAVGEDVNDEFSITLDPYITAAPIVGTPVQFDPAQYSGTPDTGPTTSYWLADDAAKTNATLQVSSSPPSGSAGKFFFVLQNFTYASQSYESESDALQILAVASTTLVAPEMTLVRSEYDPAGQTAYWRPVVQFPNQATVHPGGLVSANIQWTTSAYTFPETEAPTNQIENSVIPHPVTAGAWIIRMDLNPDNIPSGSNRNGRFDLWRAGDDGRQLRCRWRKSANDPWSPWSPFNFTVPAPEPVVVQPPPPPPGGTPDPGTISDPGWRGMIRRFPQFVGAQHVNLPGYTTVGLFRGEGFQNLECAAWSADGTAVIVGQDMGVFRISIAEAGLRPGETWTNAPFRGMRASMGLSAAFDPADRNWVLVLAGPRNMLGNTANDAEGLHVSKDLGRTATMVKQLPSLTLARRFRGWISCWPRTGGNKTTRTWYVVIQKLNNANGEVWKSTSGMDGPWTKVRDLPWASYGHIFEIIHSNIDGKLWMTTEKGIFETTNGFVGLSPVGWHGRFNKDSRGLWQDPDDANHLIAGVTQEGGGGNEATSADLGIWETTTGPNGNWTRIFNGYNPAHFGVGAKDGQGRRRMIVYGHKVGTLQKIAVRRINQSWGYAEHLNQGGPQHSGVMVTSAEQTGFVYGSPTDPDMAVIHGRSVIYHPEQGSDFMNMLPAVGYFGSELFAIAQNPQNRLEFAFAHTDQGSVYTRDGGASFRSNNVKGEALRQLIAVTTSPGGGSHFSKRIRAMAYLPDPWPAGAPAPADPKAPGRTFASYGATHKNTLLIQQDKVDQGNEEAWRIKSQSTPEGQGGGKAARHFIAVHKGNPNIGYVGVNYTKNAGGIWQPALEQIVAMDFVDNDVVYMQDPASNTRLFRSSNNGQSGPLLHTFGHENFTDANYGMVWCLPGRSRELLVGNVIGGKQDVALMRLNADFSFNSKIDLNIRSRMGGLASVLISRLEVSQGSPRDFMVTFKIPGHDFCFEVRLNAAYTGVETITNLTKNLPLVASGGAGSFDLTGEWVVGGPNGMHIHKAPAAWVGSNKNAVFEKYPKPILGVKGLP